MKSRKMMLVASLSVIAAASAMLIGTPSVAKAHMSCPNAYCYSGTGNCVLVYSSFCNLPQCTNKVCDQE
jgi:hypothetical protein